MYKNEALKVLDDIQKEHLRIAIENNITILISGKHKPTGKSTLCEFLRSKGVNVIEEWELEEAKKFQIDNNINTTYFLIYLNKRF